ncbi:phosphatase PAP2 family protein [Streptomyces sp. NPDC093225]|uniref:phosphatase PAP2 family protein n=1 Tax=Streptomyces sp. NPDC093225 TaxID=3366034 RepID=UPI0037F8AD4E
MAHRPETAVAVARGITYTGVGVVPYVLAVLGGLLAGRTGRQRVLVAGLFVVCLATGQALRYTAMRLIARPRPPLAGWETLATGWSFPSGHATTSALAAGLLALGVLVGLRRGRLPLALLALCWGAAVGLTRVYLGVHWFSDVVGGWLFALAWLSLWLWAVRHWLRGRPPPDAVPP